MRFLYLQICRFDNKSKMFKLFIVLQNTMFGFNLGEIPLPRTQVLYLASKLASQL